MKLKAVLRFISASGIKSGIKVGIRGGIKNGTRDSRQSNLLQGIGVAFLLVYSPASLTAQSNATASSTNTPSAALTQAVTRARGLIEQGQGADARALLDSLVQASPLASIDLAEALFWRAALAEQISDAERDWKRLIIEAPLSPRTPDALLRLGELDLLRGHPSDARPYFERVIREFPDSARIARGTIWLVRSYFDERDMPKGCSTLAGLNRAQVPEGELRLQADELQRRCESVVTSSNATAPATSTAASPTNTAAPTGNTTASTTNAAAPTGKAASSTGKYSVQLAAFNTRAEAQSLVTRLKKSGIEARIDGNAKPFRVRTGRFNTRAEADAALAKLKRQGHNGFVAEISS